MLAGTYRIDGVLGIGGFGITYSATDVKLERPVAIKEFFPMGSTRGVQSQVTPTTGWSHGTWSEGVERFLLEARTVARFNTAGIVHVYSVFEENNSAYMAMEFLEGTTLEARLARGRLEEADVLRFAADVGRSLSVLHAQGVLHRDLKPSNIMLTSDGRIVLIDFGTAREFVAGKTQHSVTLTPGYAPIEQYSAQARRGPFTDVYALGACMYHLLTGVAPIPATDRVVGVELTPVRALAPTVSERTAAAITGAMSMRADDRPQTVEAFLNDLFGQAPLQAAAAPVGNVPTMFDNVGRSAGSAFADAARTTVAASPDFAVAAASSAPPTVAAGAMPFLPVATDAAVPRAADPLRWRHLFGWFGATAVGLGVTLCFLVFALHADRSGGIRYRIAMPVVGLGLGAAQQAWLWWGCGRAVRLWAVATMVGFLAVSHAFVTLVHGPGGAVFYVYFLGAILAVPQLICLDTTDARLRWWMCSTLAFLVVSYAVSNYFLYLPGDYYSYSEESMAFYNMERLLLRNHYLMSYHATPFVVLMLGVSLAQGFVLAPSGLVRTGSDKA